LSGTVVREVTLANPSGLHARPCHSLVVLAGEFESCIHLEHGGRKADAASILSLMTLGAVQGSVIRIEAEGPDAEKAADAVCALIENVGEPA
jgi:phosphocarrier protein HPr